MNARYWRNGARCRSIAFQVYYTLVSYIRTSSFNVILHKLDEETSIPEFHLLVARPVVTLGAGRTGTLGAGRTGRRWPGIFGAG